MRLLANNFTVIRIENNDEKRTLMLNSVEQFVLYNNETLIIPLNWWNNKTKIMRTGLGK